MIYVIVNHILILGPLDSVYVWAQTEVLGTNGGVRHIYKHFNQSINISINPSKIRNSEFGDQFEGFVICIL